MNNDVEHLLMCLFVVCISSLVKCLFMSFVYFLYIHLCVCVFVCVCIYIYIYTVGFFKLFILLHQVFVAYRISSYGTLVGARVLGLSNCGLSCSAACGILVS